jgi:hypothetical protein
MNISTKAQTKHLRQPRAIVRAIVVVGVIASITANVLGAEDLIAAGIAGWPPVALLLSLEVLTRVPTSRRLGAFGRVIATIGVAFAAGWLSYWHMAATVSQHGESGGSQYIWPLSVDGLMTIAAIALVELGARIRQIEGREARPAQASVSAAPLIAAVEEAMKDSPEAIAFRSAQKALRKESALPALNGNAKA